jgi:hypothetical protein
MVLDNVIRERTSALRGGPCDEYAMYNRRALELMESCCYVMLRWPIILSLITYIYVVYVPFAPRTVLTVLYVDGGYNLHVGDGSFQGVYTRLTCTGLAKGGRGPRAISRLLMCWVSVCRPTEDMGLAVWPTLHRDAGPPPVPRSVALSCAR